MIHVTYTDSQGNSKTVEAQEGSTVMETALRNSIPGIDAECGGACACATCHVYVDPAWTERLPKPQSDEMELLKELSDYQEATSRLSCQVDFTDALNGLKITIAQDT